MSYTKPKFEIGQKAISPDGEVCEVIKMAFDESGWKYVVLSKEVNTKARAIVEGVKTHSEDELKEFKPEKEN